MSQLDHRQNIAADSHEVQGSTGRRRSALAAVSAGMALVTGVGSLPVAEEARPTRSAHTSTGFVEHPLEQLIYDLSATDSSVTIREVVERLAQFSQRNPEALSREKLLRILREWGSVTPSLRQTREIAQSWELVSDEQPRWVTSWLEARVTGRALVRPDPRMGGLRASYQLDRDAAHEAGVEWQEFTVTARLLNGEGVGTELWMTAMMPQTDEMLSCAVSMPSLREGQEILVSITFITYEGYDQIGSLTREMRYYVTKGADERSVEVEPRLADGTAISAETQALMHAYDAVKAAEFRLRKATEARAVHHQREAREFDAVEPVSTQLFPLLHQAAPTVTVVPWPIDPAPANALREGGEITLIGKVTLLDFWATWCGPCLTSMPKLGELHRSLEEQGFQVISLASTRNPRDFEDIDAITRRSVRHPVALASAETFEAYRIQEYPTVVLVDHTGAIRWAGIGAGALPPRTLLDELLRAASTHVDSAREERE